MEFNKHIWKRIIIAFIWAFMPGPFLLNNQISAEKEEGTKEVDIVINPSDYMFQIDNMKPGDQESQALEVINNGTEDFIYTAESKKKSGSEKLYNQLKLQITDHDHTLYDGKLSELDDMEPRSLARGKEKTLDVKLIFPYESGNEFQGLEVGTMIRLVAEAEEGESSATVTATGENETPYEDSSLGSVLPKTASNIPLFLWIGGVLVIVGGTLIIIRNKPPSKEN